LNGWFCVFNSKGPCLITVIVRKFEKKVNKHVLSSCINNLAKSQLFVIDDDTQTKELIDVDIFNTIESLESLQQNNLSWIDWIDWIDCKSTGKRW